MRSSLVNRPQTFVLKGGPQSGKTTIMRAIEAEFGDTIITVPETATALLTHLWPQIEREAAHHDAWVQTLQSGIFHTQLALEELAQIRGLSEGVAMIAFDRGVFDNAGYLGISGAQLAARFDRSLEELMSHYDLVIHLDTLAVTQPESFGSASNLARYETAEEAVSVDEKIWQAYADHPNQVRVAAKADFSEKRDTVIELVRGLL